MKSFLALVLFITVGTGQKIQGGDCVVNGTVHFAIGEFFDVNCQRLTCRAADMFFRESCPTVKCMEQIGYRPMNLSKPFPDCCPMPICRE